MVNEWEDKKQAKRAANRLSAHLSRKRRKMFIEDLKEENDDLRRKEQILRSIPDLVVAFDSSGQISFASHAVTVFLQREVEDLEGNSFWDVLTEDSVRLIKSSFMDALAVKRQSDEDSTPLADGKSITVKMLSKDGSENTGFPMSLKGMVHFAGEAPECVCSIRPGSASEEGKIISSNASVKAAKSANEQPASSAGPKQSTSRHISDIESDDISQR
jgi:PAS domain-containing protein